MEGTSSEKPVNLERKELLEGNLVSIIENFLSQKECKEFIQRATLEGNLFRG